MFRAILKSFLMKNWNANTFSIVKYNCTAHLLIPCYFQEQFLRDDILSINISNSTGFFGWCFLALEKEKVLFSSCKNGGYHWS